MTSRALTPRETAVLHLLAWGYLNSEVAVRLGLSVKTIESHKYNAMRKLKIRNRAELVRYAVEHGWMLPEVAPALGAIDSEAMARSHASATASELQPLQGEPFNRALPPAGSEVP